MKNNRIFTNQELIIILTASFLLIIMTILGNKLPDPIPAKIERHLEKEGYNIENIKFTCITKDKRHNTVIYQSSEPIFYQGRYTELWKVHCTKLTVTVYYTILPYYED